jgi:hypothetical protein
LSAALKTAAVSQPPGAAKLPPKNYDQTLQVNPAAIKHISIYLPRKQQ